MNAEFQMEVGQLKIQIAQKLHQRGILYLIKTGDQIFDNFFTSQLINSGLTSSLSTGNTLEEIQSTLSQRIELNEGVLIEIPKITNEIFNFLVQSLSDESLRVGKVIFLVPKQVVPRFLDVNEKNSFYSSCEFLSELHPNWTKTALFNGLSPILGDTLATKLANYFVDFEGVKNEEIGKALFFSENNKSKLEEFISNNQLKDESISTWHNFLDTKGIEFISKTTSKVSLDTIQAFFRSFIYEEGRQSFTIQLTINELYASVPLPKEDLDLLIEMATSPEFRILNEHGTSLGFSIPQYLTDWVDLKRWILNEEKSYQQFRLFEEIAEEYFKGTGLLLEKERLAQALILKEEIFTTYAWEEKYNLNEELFSSFLLLSQNYQEEQLKTQLKKRASLLKNSIRISIAVSIAFLLSSFTALLAYLERNSAIIQQELAIQSKEEADQARMVAEKERLEAIQARENEQSALKVAEDERLVALNAKGQAEIQRIMAVDALILAKKSEQEASEAKEVAQQNEKLANEATITAQVNFETSERLRNQQEARAAALEALGYFANKNYSEGIELVKTAYQKNLANGGFPLQSDIFNALLNGMNTLNAKDSEFNLDFPAKLIALSPNKEILAVYTINGELQIFSTLPTISFESSIKTGYIKSFEFLSATLLLGTDLLGKLFFIDLSSNTLTSFDPLLPLATNKGFFKVVGTEDLWIAHLANGDRSVYQFSAQEGFTALTGNDKITTVSAKNPLFWFEEKVFYKANLSDLKPEIVVTTPSSIQSVAWTTTHRRWMLGLENGQIWIVDPEKALPNESFSIHATKVSQLISMPYAHGTELLISAGYDGGLTILVFDKAIPISASISSRVKFQGHRSWVTGFTVDEKMKTAYSIGNDRTLKVWPLEINELLKK
uniref:hypothetical protein n=1 Tax=Algoriphagus sp. TaxID=1872435 RepID=UPI004047F7DE